MDNVLSGLDEGNCRVIVGETLWASRSVRWQSPAELLEALGDPARPVPAARIFWFYRAPAAMAGALAANGHGEIGRASCRERV